MTIREREDRDFLLAHRTGIGILWLVVVALLIIALTGCGATRSATETTRITLDDAAPSVQHALPDTLTTAPTPLPVAEMPTRPLSVQRFTEPDTTSPAQLFTAMAFDRSDDRVRIRLQDRTYTFRAPAREETLSVRPDSAGGLVAGLSGTPTPRTIEVETHPDRDRPSVWHRVQYGVAAVAGLLLLGLVIRLLR